MVKERELARRETEGEGGERVRMGEAFTQQKIRRLQGDEISHLLVSGFGIR